MKQKDCILRVRVTPEEVSRAKELATLTGDGNVSDLIRALIANARVVVRAPILEASQPMSNQRDLVLA